MLPKVTLTPPSEPRAADKFPLDNISASSMIAFSTNPILFKIKYLNRDKIDSATNVSAVIGKAFHHAMEVYYGDQSEQEGDAIKNALKAGMEYMEVYPEGWINWSSSVATRQDALERVSLAITEYVKFARRSDETTIACEAKMQSSVDIEWKGQRLRLPVPLKGTVDRLTRDKEKRLKIRDYKTCAKFSDLDKIDGAKIIQAVEYYLLAYATTGEAPYSLIYEEVKTTRNKDGGPQVREYEIVFEKNELYFDFYFRFFEDMVRAMNGEMVYVPNVRTMFDNEVAMAAYIQRLDVPDELAKKMEKHQVTTLTEVLKGEIQSASNLRQLMQAVEGQLAEAKSINYDAMKNEEKIATKLLEHGIILKFDSVVEGASVDLFRYAPSIGVKMSRLRQYADDIQQVLGANGVRVIAPIPGTTLVGFEVPRAERRFPTLPEADGFNLAIGEAVDGNVRRYDLREAPHLLVAGSTGSGKSVFLHSIIRQLQAEPGASLRLYDPKQVEFSHYEGDVTEYLSGAEEIKNGLAYLVALMDKRYAELKKLKVRDVSGTKMRREIVIIDEYADLVASAAAPKKKSKTTKTRAKGVEIVERETEGYEPGIEDHIQRLAQKGRAAGIHLIVATQRASTKIITGDIKVNFPVKVVFRMSKAIDSEVMIDEGGAEQLLGKGDMLFASADGIERLQGFNI